MAQVNINRKNADPFYRYKMPRIAAKVEGRGNGIKTVVANMVDVSRALNRPPSYATKYLGCELGAQTIIDSKNDRFIVNGSHQAEKLQDVLDGFIEKYVLCPSCENPETELLVYVKKEKIMLKCKACGALNTLKFVHRVNQFIFKCPPTQKTSQNKETTPSSSNKKSNGSTEDVQKVNNKELIEISENLPTTSSSISQWAVDTSEEAQKLRIQQLEGRAKVLTMNEDMEKCLKDRIDIFQSYLEKVKDALSEKDYRGIVDESERLDISEYAVTVLFGCVFSDGTILRSIKTHEKLIGMLVGSNSKAQRNLLGAIESLIERNKEKLLSKVSHIFKLLYDLDLVAEEAFFKWESRTSTRFISDKEFFDKIHQSALPFITWLKTAEEESSSEDDNDVSVEFEDKFKVTTSEPSKPTQQINNKKEKEEIKDEDDINIDDI